MTIIFIIKFGWNRTKSVSKVAAGDFYSNKVPCYRKWKKSVKIWKLKILKTEKKWSGVVTVSEKNWVNRRRTADAVSSCMQIPRCSLLSDCREYCVLNCLMPWTWWKTRTYTLHDPSNMSKAWNNLQSASQKRVPFTKVPHRLLHK